MNRGKSFEAQGPQGKPNQRLAKAGGEELSVLASSLNLDRDMTEGFFIVIQKRVTIDRFESLALDSPSTYLPHCFAWKADGAELAYTLADSEKLTIMSPRLKFPIYTVTVFETVIRGDSRARKVQACDARVERQRTRQDSTTSLFEV